LQSLGVLPVHLHARQNVEALVGCRITRRRGCIVSRSGPLCRNQEAKQCAQHRERFHSRPSNRDERYCCLLRINQPQDVSPRGVTKQISRPCNSRLRVIALFCADLPKSIRLKSRSNLSPWFPLETKGGCIDAVDRWNFLVVHTFPVDDTGQSIPPQPTILLYCRRRDPNANSSSSAPSPMQRSRSRSLLRGCDLSIGGKAQDQISCRLGLCELERGQCGLVAPKIRRVGTDRGQRLARVPLSGLGTFSSVL
jgi:hypothetical protein